MKAPTTSSLTKEPLDRDSECTGDGGYMGCSTVGSFTACSGDGSGLLGASSGLGSSLDLYGSGSSGFSNELWD